MWLFTMIQSRTIMAAYSYARILIVNRTSISHHVIVQLDKLASYLTILQIYWSNW